MTTRHRVGQYLIEVSKLLLGGVVLNTVLTMKLVSRSAILIIGIGSVVIFCSYGLFLLKEK